MKRIFLAAVVAIMLIFPGHVAVAKQKARPECDKQCRRSNDYWLTDFEDYFVNDSDGGKDSVFTIYRNIQFGDKKCDVVKTYEDVGVDIEVVCP